MLIAFILLGYFRVLLGAEESGAGIDDTVQIVNELKLQMEMMQSEIKKMANMLTVSNEEVKAVKQDLLQTKKELKQKDETLRELVSQSQKRGWSSSYFHDHNTHITTATSINNYDYNKYN